MYTVLSLHYGFSMGGVAKYASLLEKVSEYRPVVIRSICIKRPGRFLDTETMSKMDMLIVEQKAIGDVFWFRRCLQIIEELQPDALMVHGFNGYIIAVILNWLMREKLPLLCSNHGMYYAPSVWKSPMTIPYNLGAEYVLRRHAEAIITVCRFSKDFLIKRGVPSDRITIVYNGISADLGMIENRRTFRRKLNLNDGHIVIGAISRLDKEKGVECLLDAFRFVATENHDMRLIIIGTGSLEQSLRRRVYNYGLEGRVIFTGYRSDTANLMNVLDIFVLPSLAENHSISLLEAMRAGLAIIATNVGGNTESISDQKEGLIVPPKDASAIAESLRTLAISKDLRLQYGQAARKRFLNYFTEDVMIKKTAAWIQESITKAKTKAGID